MVDTKSGNYTDVQTLFRASQGGAVKASEHKGGWQGRARRTAFLRSRRHSDAEITLD